MQPPQESENPVAPFPLDDVLSGEDKDAIRESVGALMDGSGESPTYLSTNIPEFENVPLRTSTERVEPLMKTGAETPGPAAGPSFFKAPPRPYEAGVSSALVPEEFLPTAPAVAADAATKTPKQEKTKPHAVVFEEVPIAPPSPDSEPARIAAADASPSLAVAKAAGAFLVLLGLLLTGLVTTLFYRSSPAPGSLANPAIAIPTIAGFAVAFGTVATGIGCFAGRVWARAAALAGCAVAVAAGMLLLIRIYLAPETITADAIPGLAEGTPQASATIVVTLTTAVLMTLLGLLTLYFGSQSTTEKFRRSDPNPSRLRSPVMAGSLVLFLIAAVLGTLAASGGTPLFFALEISRPVLGAVAAAFAAAAMVNLSASRGAWFLVLVPIAVVLARLISAALSHWEASPLALRQDGLFILGIAVCLFLYHTAVVSWYGRRPG